MGERERGKQDATLIDGSFLTLENFELPLQSMCSVRHVHVCTHVHVHA